MMSSVILCLLLPAIVSSLEKPKDMSQEMFCMSCQSVIKELDLTLRQKPTRGVGETVSRALKQVCHENNFKKYELNYKTILTVCKHIKDDENMETLLVSEYSRIHEQGIKQSYIDITQKICGTLFNACIETTYIEHGEDGGIKYDAETEEFSIKHGKKVKVARPVVSGTKQPNQTPTPDRVPVITPDLHTADGHDEL